LLYFYKEWLCREEVQRYKEKGVKNRQEIKFSAKRSATAVTGFVTPITQ